MPLYYFHLQSSTKIVHDKEGIELQDLDSVREEAVQSAREIMSQQVLKGDQPNDRTFLIEDAEGNSNSDISLQGSARKLVTLLRALSDNCAARPCAC
jgi:hypothetical protein